MRCPQVGVAVVRVVKELGTDVTDVFLTDGALQAVASLDFLVVRAAAFTGLVIVLDVLLVLVHDRREGIPEWLVFGMEVRLGFGGYPPRFELPGFSHIAMTHP